MAKANSKVNKGRFFIKRGESILNFEFNDEDIEINVIIPTNYENDKLVEQFTSITNTGTMDIHGADLLEARFMNFVKELSFDIPLNNNLDEYALWSVANENQKRNAIRLMDPELRDAINERLLGKIALSEDVAGN